MTQSCVLRPRVTVRPDPIDQGPDDQEGQKHEQAPDDHRGQRPNAPVDDLLQDAIQNHGDDQRYDGVARGVTEEAAALSLAYSHLLQDRRPPLLRVSNPESQTKKHGRERLQDEAKLEAAAEDPSPTEIGPYRFEERHRASQYRDRATGTDRGRRLINDGSVRDPLIDRDLPAGSPVCHHPMRGMKMTRV